MKEEVYLSKARLALLLHAPESELGGGIQTFTQHLKKAFPQLEIFPRPEWPSECWLTRKKIKIWYLDWLKNDCVYSRLFFRLHKERPFDLLFTLSFTGLSLQSDRLKIPVINLYLGCFKEFIHQTMNSSLSVLWQKVIAGRMDQKSGRGKYCTVISGQLKKDIKRHYDHDSLVIPLGVDLKNIPRQEKMETRRKLNLPPDRPIGLFIGSAHFAKGWDIVLKTAEVLPDIHFACVTDIPPSSISLKNIRIEKNTLDKESLDPWYQACDFFLFPSRYEGGGYVVLEAMSFNLPVLLSPWVGSVFFGGYDHWGPSEGVYIVEGKEGGYAEAIRDFLRSGKEPRTRLFVEKHHTLKQFCERYRETVLNLLKNGL